MNRVVLGTASLGSAVSPRVAARVLEAACREGVDRFDTGPFYGAGYAPALLGAMHEKNVRVSTKFGSRQEPAWRYLFKRLLAFGAPEPVWRNWPQPQDPRARAYAAWWDAERQRPAIVRAVTSLGGLAPEFLFLHAPPLVLPSSVIAALRGEAARHGFALGVCSPVRTDVDAWLDAALNADGGLSCMQLHLDDVLALQPAQLQRLFSMRVWIHGIYSPGREARLQAHADREAYCIELASRAMTTAFVIGAKTPQGIGRLSRFAARLPASSQSL